MKNREYSQALDGLGSIQEDAVVGCSDNPEWWRPEKVKCWQDGCEQCDKADIREKTEPATESQVYIEINKILYVLDLIGIGLCSLDERLKPVLSPVPPSTKPEGNTKELPLAPLADDLNLIRRRIEDYAKGVNELVARCEL